MRIAEISRKTNETDVQLKLNLDGNGQYHVHTGVGFLDHMLELFAKHGFFDLEVTCQGDVAVDGHHSVEDIGICLGMAFRQALGDKIGIRRYGYFILPMDEALILSAVDFSGRSYIGYDLQIPSQKVGDFDTELVEEFWRAFSGSACMNLHIRQLSGSNSHHIIEGAFKSVAHAVRQAVEVDKDHCGGVLSTKGVL